jgi:hypothetical protein
LAHHTPPKAAWLLDLFLARSVFCARLLKLDACDLVLSRRASSNLTALTEGNRVGITSTRLFVMTLGYSRKSVRLLTFRSSSRIWAELHEKAFRRLGGSPRVLVLDNLKDGVLVL